jgi:hypothetical protein
MQKNPIEWRGIAMEIYGARTYWHDEGGRMMFDLLFEH